MKRIAILLIGLAVTWALPAQSEIAIENDTLSKGVYSDEQISEILRNMPNIEVGKGLTFKTKDDKYKLTLRLRMQSLAGITLNDQLSVTQTEACIKRLRLRFDGHVEPFRRVSATTVVFNSQTAWNFHRRPTR